MARIRSIKPEFFKHLELQELENEYRGQYVMFVYAGLWTQCDKNGVFFYNSKVIKNEILPYIDFDMQKSLDILEKNKYFIKYTVNGRDYGFIQNFEKYQFPTKNEKDSPAKYPLPPNEILEQITHFETLPSTPEDVPENVPENHTKAEGLKDNRSKDNRITGAADSEKDISKYFISLWQSHPDEFNIFTRFKDFDSWKKFWSLCNYSKQQIEIAVKNVVEAVRRGDLARRYVPKTPDDFVLNGWLLRGLDDYKSPEARKEQERDAKSQALVNYADKVCEEQSIARENVTTMSIVDGFKEVIKRSRE